MKRKSIIIPPLYTQVRQMTACPYQVLQGTTPEIKILGKTMNTESY